MAPLDPVVQTFFWLVCGGVAASFLVMIFALTLARKLFGVLENDEDWNG